MLVLILMRMRIQKKICSLRFNLTWDRIQFLKKYFASIDFNAYKITLKNSIHLDLNLTWDRFGY